MVILDWLSEFFQWLIEWAYTVWDDLLLFIAGLLVDDIVWTIEALDGLLPAGFMAYLNPLWEFLGYLDGWLALSVGFKLFTTYYTIKMVFVVFRYVKSLIPFVG